MLDKGLVNYIEKRVNDLADDLEMNAAYSGSMSDSGASRKRENLAFWLSGVRQDVPKQYAQLANEFESKKDPEYQKYLELKKKFEGE